MAPDELAAAVRAELAEVGGVREVKMFGGIGFMLKGNMVVAASKRGLLARIGEDAQAKALKTAGVRPMEMQGRVMKDYVFVDPDALSKPVVAKWLKAARLHVEKLPAKTVKAKKTASKPTGKRS